MPRTRTPAGTRTPTRASARAPWSTVRCVAFDVDGVMTDGRIYLDDHRVDTKGFNSQDGAGIAYLVQSGLRTAVITGRRSRAVLHRARELKIDLVYQQPFPRKLEALEKLVARLGIPPEEICYLGDDLADVPVMRRVGLPVAVANARAEVKAFACYVTRAPGGHGAIREVAEKVLAAQGKWAAILERYLGADGARAVAAARRTNGAARPRGGE
ncbi:MAG: HAD-IIIA family hydrolase [Planctomycetes bacterium]|nr:HAD-IIIA family hydrolase [Planctomycetota bacterium]